MTTADRIETCRGILNERLVKAENQSRILRLAPTRPDELQCLLDMLADVESGTDPSFEQLDLAGIVERGETGSGLYSEVRAYWLVLRQLAHIEQCLGVQHGA